MKKKILLATLAAACIMGGAAALVGCNNGGEHSHTYSEDWSYNDTNHFHKCTKEGCNYVSGSQAHQTSESTTATCTEAGVKTTYCTVEGCEWSKNEAQGALGHDWDEEHPVQAATHLSGGILKCKHEDCTETLTTDPVPHEYEWAYKDNATHTGVCKDAGCSEVPAVEQAHKFTESTIGSFTVNTCSDCGAELAEVQVNLFKRINDKQSTAYTGADLKVSLHKAGDGNYTKVYEATADPETGVATLQIQPGAYWIQITDETNGYLSADANWIRFDKTTAASDATSRNIILSEPAQYTVKVLYDNDETNPAAGVSVSVNNGYKFIDEPSMDLGEGVTDGNGEVTFTLASSIDLVYARNLHVHIAGIDEENYDSETNRVFDGVANGTKIISLSPLKRAYTIKVKAEENFIEGVGVKLTKPEYNEELQKFIDKVVASGTTDENGQFVTDVIDNSVYTVVLDLPDEIAENWRLPYYQTYTSGTGEVIVDLINLPAYNLTVYTSSSKEWEKSGIKLTVKDLEDNVVAEGLTDEDGKFTAKLEFAEYKVYIDESTIPEGFTVTSPFTTVPTTSGSNNASTLNKTTNTVNWSISISEVADITVTVRSGPRSSYVYYENVIVKFYQDGELKYASQPTAADGTATIKGINGVAYDVVCEGLPENFVCTVTTTTVRASSPTLTATLESSANFALTIKDKDGNALEDATVSLVTYAYSNQGYYTIAEAAKGVTGAGGTVNIAWILNKNYTVNVVAADGTKYFGQANLTSATQGETVTKELTVYTYDEEMPLTGNKAPTMYYTGDFIGKEVLVTCTSKRNETFAYMSSDGTETLAAGTYKFEISNPCGINYKVVTKCGYDENSWGVGVITESNDYMTIEKDESGNIVSVTVNFNNANDASWFNICIGHDVGEGETATDLFRLIVKVTKVEA